MGRLKGIIATRDENAVDERRRFLPMAKGRTVKSDEKTAIPEPHFARCTKAQMHFREATKNKTWAASSIFGGSPEGQFGP